MYGGGWGGRCCYIADCPGDRRDSWQPPGPGSLYRRRDRAGTGRTEECPECSDRGHSSGCSGRTPGRTCHGRRGSCQPPGPDTPDSHHCTSHTLGWQSSASSPGCTGPHTLQPGNIKHQTYHIHCSTTLQYSQFLTCRKYLE